MSKTANSKESKHLSRVANLGCAVCWHLGFGDARPEIHHIRQGQGMSQRASHYLTIPLCPDHHRGTHGVHGDRQSLKMIKKDELSLLAWVIEQLQEGK